MWRVQIYQYFYSVIKNNMTFSSDFEYKIRNSELQRKFYFTVYKLME
jgi:hypothetical protein